MVKRELAKVFFFVTEFTHFEVSITNKDKLGKKYGECSLKIEYLKANTMNKQ